jgi:hypothetical protein
VVDRPILFSGPMIRAILARTKTQTRRLVLQRVEGPNQHNIFDWYDSADKWLGAHGGNNLRLRGGGPLPFNESSAAPLCPYGRPGDRLWVRETLRNSPDGWRYDADGTAITMDRADERYPAMLSWAHHTERDVCVSIHMPRWASRLTLEVTSVRVERLQDITEQDALAEGVPGDGPVGNMRVWSEMGRYRYQFAGLWDKINSKRCPWSSNPWVWVVSFKRAEPAHA